MCYECFLIVDMGPQKIAQDAQWWLHLYVMFSRATSMEDMLLLRPPPRQLLEAGPPADVLAALAEFETKVADSTAAAVLLANTFGMHLPA